MRAGDLRHRVTIQRAVTSQDDYGQPIEVWEDVDTVWAKMEDLTGREYFAAQQVPTAQVTTRVTIRWRSDIEPSMRLIAGNRILDIQSVIDPDGRRRELQLMCKEVV